MFTFTQELPSRQIEIQGACTGNILLKAYYFCGTECIFVYFVRKLWARILFLCVPIIMEQDHQELITYLQLKIVSSKIVKTQEYNYTHVLALGSSKKKHFY